MVVLNALGALRAVRGLRCSTGRGSAAAFATTLVAPCRVCAAGMRSGQRPSDKGSHLR